MKLSLDEQETNISQSATNRKEWIIYTDDSVRIKEYKRKGLTIQKETETGCYFVLPDNQLTVRKPRKQAILTDEQRNERRLRLEQMRRNR